MALRFIIGRAGTGKTRFCLDEVRQELVAHPDGPPLILLVPEQATFQVEYALAVSVHTGGFLRAQVLSFQRMAYRVLQETGGAVRAHIGEMGKRMMLSRLLAKHKGSLKVFNRSAGQLGFTDTLSRMISELKTHCLKPARLASVAATLRKAGGSVPLADKLTDLHLLYSDLDICLSGTYSDPDDYLELLAGRLKQSKLARDARVWADGFSGFTPQEYQVLAALMKVARQVNITLCLDPDQLGGEPEETGLFYPVRRTYDKIVAIAGQEGIQRELAVRLSGNFGKRFDSRAIARLEKHFHTRPSPPPDDMATGVTLATAVNPRAEVEGVAREITALCRDRGLRYRDMVIFLRNLEPYAHLISSIFDDHCIPVFIDQKRRVIGHPLVELVRSALEVVATNWSHDPVFRYLKTDLVPVSRDDVDRLENYVLAHGIRGRRWYDGGPWNYRRRYTLDEESGMASAAEIAVLDAINQIRHSAVACLTAFYGEVAGAGNVRETTAALFRLLAGLRVPERLEEWSSLAEQSGRLEDAREHSQIWGGLSSLLDQVVEVLGGDTLSLREYIEVIDAGLQNFQLGLIPPGLDQVLVCSLERSRSPGARVSFVMGVNEGVLPARASDKNLFTSEEREILQESGLHLAPGSRQRLFEEQYLVYLALTRSSELLYISCPLADEEGGSLLPSPLVARVKELLPGAAEKFWLVEPGTPTLDDLEFISNPGRSLSYLSSRLREAGAGRLIDPLWWDVYDWFAGGRHRSECAGALAGLFHNNLAVRLPGDISGRLYGKPLKTGVSGLESYRSCPFAYYLSRGLKLAERAEFRLRAPDLGQFFHAALRLFAEKVQEQELDWEALNSEQCRDLAGKAVDQLAPRLHDEILFSTERHRYLAGKLKRIVQRSAMALTEHFRRGSFRPVGLELAFGPGETIPPLRLALADGNELLLTGRIDRLDSAACEDRVYLRVVDYKSGRQTIGVADIYHGLKLQLLAYLDVALEHAGILTGSQALPGGMLYFRLDDPLVKTSGGLPLPGIIEETILKEFRMTGLVLADPEAINMMDRGLSGNSLVIPVYLKKDGELGVRSSALSTEQFNLLRLLLRQRLIEAANRIVSGVIDILPYRRGNFYFCQYCSYRAVCHFDVLVEGNRFRVIKEVDEQAIWQNLARLAEGGDDNGDLD